LLTALVASLLAMLVIKFLFGLLFVPSLTAVLDNFFFITLINLTVTTMFVSLNYAIRFYEEIEKRLISERQAREMAVRAQLEALKAQMNPHFLFNTLNAIAALTRLDPVMAEKTTEKLAEMYRYVLYSSKKEFATLQQELDFTDAYLSIEKARLGENLDVEITSTPQLADAKIPSLIIQPVVENAIKHGVSLSSHETRVEVSAKMGDDCLRIEVRDNGPGIQEEMPANLFRKGTGLGNIVERLRRIYDEEGLLQIVNRKPKGVAVVMNIPQNRRI